MIVVSVSDNFDRTCAQEFLSVNYIFMLLRLLIIMAGDRGYSGGDFAGNNFEEYDDEEYCDRADDDDDDEEEDDDEDDYKEENARQETEEQARMLLEKAKVFFIP